MGFETIRQVKVGELEIAFREVGEGEPLLLVHGWPLSSWTWRKVVGPLSEGFRCIALDLPGAGESLGIGERDLRMPSQSQVVGGFADALGLERTILIGHDSGGSIARGWAVESPERVSRLVLAGTEVPGHRPLPVILIQRLARLPGARSLLRATFGSQRLARSPLGFGLGFADVGRFDFDEFFESLVEPIQRSEAALDGIWRFIFDFDFADVDAVGERYDALRMPKLVLWGDGDRFFPVAQGRRLHDMLPEPRRFELVPGGGLLLHEEKPEPWVRRVRAFLEETAGLR